MHNVATWAIIYEYKIYIYKLTITDVSTNNIRDKQIAIPLISHCVYPSQISSVGQHLKTSYEVTFGK